MRVLFLPLYPSLWPSSRYRAHLWADALEREGFHCRVLGPPDGRVSRAAYYAAVFGLARRFDVVFIQKKLFPGLVLRLLTRLNPRLVFDFDDALFARPTDVDERTFAERATKDVGRLDRTLRSARLVVAGNRYLEEYARQWNCRVAVVPTAIDLERLPPLPAPRRPGDPVVIGWIGRSSNLPSLDLLAGALAALSDKVGKRFVLRVVADGVDRAPYAIQGVRVENVVWTLAAEYTAIDGFDIGVMPLVDDAWNRGKCGFKLLQCMSRGVPVVASPVGVNSEILEDGVNGFLAATEAEWTEKLATLIADPALRVRLGKAGAETVAASYSFRTVIPTLADLLSKVATPGAGDDGR